MMIKTPPIEEAHVTSPSQKAFRPQALKLQFFHSSSFLNPLLFSSSPRPPHGAPTTSNPVASGSCWCVCLCVFLPAAKIQQLQWPLNSSTNKSRKQLSYESELWPLFIGWQPVMSQFFGLTMMLSMVRL